MYLKNNIDEVLKLFINHLIRFQVQLNVKKLVDYHNKKKYLIQFCLNKVQLSIGIV